MGYRKDLTGKRSGKLIITSFSHYHKMRSQWKAKCDCGNETIVDVGNFNIGASTSCGCNRKGYRTPNKGHGLYTVWLSMRSRCNNQKEEYYHRYGGRGIKVCERWDNYETFFSDVIEGYKPGLELDRHPNNDGNYEPTNVRWATRSEQVQNSTSATLNEDQVREIRKAKEGLKELSEKYKVTPSTIWKVKTFRSWKNI